MTSFFQAMTALTTVGFNTVPIGGLAHSVLFLILLLMILGASPSGTGGGIKSTTVTAVYAQMLSSLRGKDRVEFGGRFIPRHRLATATASVAFYALSLCAGVYLLLLTEPLPLPDLVFEATSALGTVGLSMGITPALSALGKLVVIVLMFAGRVGPLSLGAALFAPRNESPREEDLAV